MGESRDYLIEKGNGRLADKLKDNIRKHMGASDYANFLRYHTIT